MEILNRFNSRLKLLLIIFAFCAIASCSNENPYEETFKNRFIESVGIEPIVELITIDSKLDSSILREYYLRELEKNRNDRMARAKEDYEKVKEKYDRSLKYEGKRMADVVYSPSLIRSKNSYDDLISGAKDSMIYEFYYQRLKSPTIFEELTVKFRVSKDGPLLVKKYRADIFNGDTSFYELKSGRSIQDYIKE